MTLDPQATQPHSLYAPGWMGPQGRPWPFYPEQMISDLIRVPTDRGPVVAVNPLIDSVGPWYQNSDPNQTIALAANGTSEVAWRIPSASGLRGDAEIFHLASVSTGRFTVEGYLAGSIDRTISNVPIPNNCLFGTAQLPHEVGESIWMESAGHINWRLTDISGIANNVEIVGFGRRFINYNVAGMDRDAIIEAFRNRNSHPYYLSWTDLDPTIGGISVASLATVDNSATQMQLPSDGDFICMGAMDDSDGPYRLEMFAGESGLPCLSGPTHRDLFAGTTTTGGGIVMRAASNPFRWRQPIRFTRRTVIRFRIQNLMAGANTIRLVLFGRKIYYPEMGRQPVEFFPPNRVTRPVATPGAGTWQGLGPQSWGPWLQPPVQPGISPNPWGQ